MSRYLWVEEKIVLVLTALFFMERIALPAKRKNKMSTIPLKMRAEMAEDPYYRTCARKALLDDHTCVRDVLEPWKPVDWEHALYYSKGKIQEKYAIIPLCWLVHRGPLLNKEINKWIALNRATESEIEKISKVIDYKAELDRLNLIYGVPTLSDPEIQYE